MKHRVKITHYVPTLGIQVMSVQVCLPDNSRVERVELVADAVDDIVRVRFGWQKKEYNYICPNAKVGDWVIVPPNETSDNYQVVQVTGVGGSVKSGWSASVNATLLPSGVMP